ncbi:hypothetical protein NL676_031218 [Syzygium grande]|nr:hypothetical protein NL676_031218 [Syzygium grande]
MPPSADFFRAATPDPGDRARRPPHFLDPIHNAALGQTSPTPGSRLGHGGVGPATRPGRVGGVLLQRVCAWVTIGSPNSTSSASAWHAS